MNYFLSSEASASSAVHELAAIPSLRLFGSTTSVSALVATMASRKCAWPRFIADVTEQLDLSAIYSAYDRRVWPGGKTGYHPLLMTRLHAVTAIAWGW